MRRVLPLAALSLLALSAPASAQRSASMASPSPEVGMDAGITFLLGTNSATLIDLPAQRIRVGFFVSPTISIEPTFGLRSISGGGTTFTAYSIGSGLLYHFSKSRAANQFYLRPFLEVQGFSETGAPSSSAATFGVGGGLKVPLRDRIASRFEANFAHQGGQNNQPGQDLIGLLAGLSFYTR